MRKGIAIQTILLLLVGILVVGIVVYMVYRYLLSPGMTEQECRGKAITWCTSCKNSMTAQGSDCAAAWTAAAGCTGGPTATDALQSCAGDFFGGIAGTTCLGMRGWCASFVPV